MKKVKLGDICEVLNGYAFKSNEYVERGIRVVRITNVQSGYIEDNDPKFYKIEKQNELGKYMLKQNDLLISLTGNVGRVAILDKKFLPAALNQRVACLRSYAVATINNRYLYYLLSSNSFINKCVNSAQGIAQKNMSTEWLKNYEIKLLDLETQIKIVNKLDKIQEIIDIRKKQLELCDKIINSKFAESFGNQINNSMKFEEGRIRDVVMEVKYGTSKPAVAGGKYKYIRMNNITYGGELDLTDLKYIDIPEKEIGKCIAKKGDLLFNRTNSKELVGKTCVFNENEDMVIAGYIIRVRMNERALPEYLSAVLNSEYGKSILFNLSKSIVGQANINAQELQDIKILIPPIELQYKFKKIKEYIEKTKYEMKKLLKELENIKITSMNTYFK